MNCVVATNRATTHLPEVTLDLGHAASYASRRTGTAAQRQHAYPVDVALP
jgi:hypothetical protein